MFFYWWQDPPPSSGLGPLSFTWLTANTPLSMQRALILPIPSLSNPLLSTTFTDRLFSLEHVLNESKTEFHLESLFSSLPLSQRHQRSAGRVKIRTLLLAEWVGASHPPLWVSGAIYKMRKMPTWHYPEDWT